MGTALGAAYRENAGERSPKPPSPWVATTFSKMTLSITSLSIQVLYVTLSINDTQHNCTFSITRLCVMFSVIMLNVAFYLLIC